MTTLTETTLRFACPTTGEALVATIDDLGRLMVEPAEPDDGPLSEKTEAWIDRLYGKGRDYLAVVSTGDARRQLAAKGVEW